MSLIKIIKYIILGAIQGFTEPIPISSSGHIVIFKHLFNEKLLNDINFEIVVNFGSLIAICFFYRKEIIKLINDFFMYLKTKKDTYKNNYTYVWLIAFGTIPAGLFGFIFKDRIDTLSNNIKLVGIALLITSVALFFIKDNNGVKEKNQITFFDSLIIGLFQTIALFPGISRSGATIVGASNRNLSREESLNFSFMLYIPISIATLILGFIDVLKTDNISNLLLPYTLGAISSAVITYFSTKWFINIMEKGKLIYFSVYCLIMGIIVCLFM